MMANLATIVGEEMASRIRHYGGFVLAGLMAFAADAAILEALVRGAAVSPFLARPVGIPVGMVVSWLVNRRVTFAVHTRPTVAEFLHFAAVSWAAQLVNYLIFAAILALSPETTPFIALVVASAISMFFSYSGFRYVVFRARRRPGAASKADGDGVCSKPHSG